ncbi:hypothetical protein BJX99DRAFT_104374 [Aspergillus californicus]
MIRRHNRIILVGIWVASLNTISMTSIVRRSPMGIREAGMEKWEIAAPNPHSIVDPAEQNASNDITLVCPNFPHIADGLVWNMCRNRSGQLARMASGVRLWLVHVPIARDADTATACRSPVETVRPPRYSQERTPRIVREFVGLEEPQVQDAAAAREMQEKCQDVTPESTGVFRMEQNQPNIRQSDCLIAPTSVSLLLDSFWLRVCRNGGPVLCSTPRQLRYR